MNRLKKFLGLNIATASPVVPLEDETISFIPVNERRVWHRELFRMWTRANLFDIRRGEMPKFGPQHEWWAGVLTIRRSYVSKHTTRKDYRWF